MNDHPFEQLQAQGALLEPKKSVLIIDDDAEMSEVLANRLDRLGYAAHTAVTGQLGLSSLRSHRPSLVVLDLRLPDADGLEICQQITDDPESCMIPVIIVSGMDRPDVVRQARRAGCLYYIRKPYDPNALLALIEKSLNEAESW